MLLLNLFGVIHVITAALAGLIIVLLVGAGKREGLHMYLQQR